MRRGQTLSAFIIIGFLLMAGFLYYMYATTLTHTLPTLATTDALHVQSFITSCIEETGSKALFTLGRQGGHLEEPSPSHWEPYGAIGYGFYEERKTFVSKEAMTASLQAYITEHLPACLNDFDEFKAQGIDVNPRHIKTTALLTQEDVVLTVEYPIKVQIEGRVKTLERFGVHLPVRLLHIHVAVDGFMDHMAQAPAYMDITYLGALDMNSTILTDESGESVIVLTDLRSELYNRPYTFITAIRYPEERT